MNRTERDRRPEKHDVDVDLDPGWRMEYQLPRQFTFGAPPEEIRRSVRGAAFRQNG